MSVDQWHVGIPVNSKIKPVAAGAIIRDGDRKCALNLLLGLSPWHGTIFLFLRPWQTRTHCCGHIVADTNVSPFAPARNICCGHKKMFLISFRNILCPQQMFPSLRSMETQHSFCVPRVCAPKKHHKQQCVRNKVSSFARAFRTNCAIACGTRAYMLRKFLRMSHEGNNFRNHRNVWYFWPTTQYVYVCWNFAPVFSS